jgi:hypothetical protein
MVYSNDPSQKVNLQAWFHEATGSVAYHFGPNTITNKALLSSYCGMVVFDQAFTALLDQYNIKGDPAAQQTTTGQTSLSFPGMTGIPDDGKVLTFNKAATTSIATLALVHARIYPNPAYDMVTVQPASQEKTTVSLVNGLGQTVYIAETTGAIQIPLSEYPAGIYQVLTATTNTNSNNTLIINR